MSDTPTLTGQDIGEAQKAVEAVLHRLLAETGTSFLTWVTLNSVVIGGSPVGRDVLVARMAAGLKVDVAAVEAALARAVEAGLVRVGHGDRVPAVELTPAGQGLHGRISAGVSRVQPELYGGIPQADLAAAHRVLRQVIDRANAYLVR